ncbi:HAD family hydrolase, partial [Bittarella massiliensis (ex Durand et al. 2017)]
SVPEKTPSKEGIIREALAEMGIDEADADKVLMVGDSPYDEEGAAAVGCRFAAATYGFGYLGITDGLAQRLDPAQGLGPFGGEGAAEAVGIFFKGPLEGRAR